MTFLCARGSSVSGRSYLNSTGHLTGVRDLGLISTIFLIFNRMIGTGLVPISFRSFSSRC